MEESCQGAEEIRASAITFLCFSGDVALPFPFMAQMLTTTAVCASEPELERDQLLLRVGFVFALDYFVPVLSTRTDFSFVPC